MIADLKPYPAYKNSGVEWLGEMPEHWGMRKLRCILSNVTERNRPDLPLLSVVREKGIVLRDVSSKDGNHNFIPEDLTNYKVVRAGQFAMNKMKAWQGSYGVSRYDGIVSPAYFIFNVAHVLGDFFHTATRSLAYVPFFTQASDGVRIGQWDLSQARMREITFSTPPILEQAAIVRFLDYADRRIRRYIRAKQKLIGLLEEQKQAIIHRAVTRGLDPDLRLKPTGIEWLGDVPEHWEVLRTRYLFWEVDQRSTTGQETHLSMSQRLGLVPSEMVERTLTSESYVGGKLCEKDDLVLNRLKAHLGVFALATQAGVISPDYSVFRKKRPLKVSYLERVLRSPACRRELRIRAKGIVEGFWRLYTDDFYDIRLPVPPVGEQEEIIKTVDQAAGDINTTIDRARREIELLQEYRTRLIADVVTGKLDVREAAAKLPDEPELFEEADDLTDSSEDMVDDLDTAPMETEA
ncbi:MAG: hypothetical protein R8K46_03980 [Mariprofundaceae bacterium]